ncbi:MAG: hypothetical protein ACTTJH_08195 [Bacteroidales bacterium]
MKEKKEHNFELRSEKVCSIVGQIPSALVHYGITVIGVALGCLFAVAYFLPYKQIYSGTAIVHQIEIASTDSTDITIMLKFEDKHPNNANGQMIYLQAPNDTFVGHIRNLSSIRDTLEYQKALCHFKNIEIRSLRNQTVNFLIVQPSGNLLRKMLGNIEP